jgi:hypothetical protein
MLNAAMKKPAQKCTITTTPSLKSTAFKKCLIDIRLRRHGSSNTTRLDGLNSRKSLTFNSRSIDRNLLESSRDWSPSRDNVLLSPT